MRLDRTVAGVCLRNKTLLASLILLAALVSWGPIEAFAQIPLARKEPAAMALLARTSASLGSRVAAADSVAHGVMVIQDKRIPFVIKTLGTDRSRVELEMPSGHRVFVVNGGEAEIRQDGKTRRLSRANILARRIVHVPALSALADFGDDDADVEMEKAAENLRAGKDVVVIRGHKPARIKVPPDLEQRTRAVRAILDPTTGELAALEYATVAESDPSAGAKTEVRYSDYRRVKSVAVPFHQENYFDGQLESVVTIEDIDFNVGVNSAEFALTPEDRQ